MSLDPKNLKAASLEDLHAASLAISAERDASHALLKAVNDEITIRENMDARVGHIEHLSDEELDRALAERTARRAKAQDISHAGDVPSAEVVAVPGAAQ